MFCFTEYVCRDLSTSIFLFLCWKKLCVWQLLLFPIDRWRLVHPSLKRKSDWMDRVFLCCALAVTVQWAAECVQQMIGYWQVSVLLTLLEVSPFFTTCQPSSSFPENFFPPSPLLLHATLSLSVIFRLMNEWQPHRLIPFFVFFELAYHSLNRKDAWSHLDGHRKHLLLSSPSLCSLRTRRMACRGVCADTHRAPGVWMFRLSIVDKSANSCILFPSHLSHKWVLPFIVSGCK